MLKRYAPPKRSTKPLKRTPLKRPTKRIRQVGTVGKRKQKARDHAKAAYFKKHGKHGLAKCQWCRADMARADANAHHKKPRGEGGNDELVNMVVVHKRCHLNVIHFGMPGRPSQPPSAVARFALVELCEANAVNGLFIPKEIHEGYEANQD